MRAEDIDKAHGRIEIRRIAVRSKLPAYLDRNWSGLMRIVRIERTRETKILCSRQIIYAITSIPEQQMSAQDLLALARAHWQIENRLFHVRDVTFQEDACRVRSGQAPQALVHIRDAALTLIRQRKLKPRPAREAFAANPKAAIRVIQRS
ncbi:MAG: ISAs1 family transposase [Hyphomicrobiales bacterium]